MFIGPQSQIILDRQRRAASLLEKAVSRFGSGLRSRSVPSLTGSKTYANRSSGRERNKNHRQETHLSHRSSHISLRIGDYLWKLFPKSSPGIASATSNNHQINHRQAMDLEVSSFHGEDFIPLVSEDDDLFNDEECQGLGFPTISRGFDESSEIQSSRPQKAFVTCGDGDHKWSIIASTLASALCFASFDNTVVEPHACMRSIDFCPKQRAPFWCLPCFLAPHTALANLPSL